jgi:Bacterial Ig domain
MSSARVRFRRKTANQISYLAALLLISIFSVGIAGCSGVVSGNSANSGSPNPLAISNVQASVPTTTGFQVSWSTNIAANSAIDYGTTASYGSSTPVNGSMVTSHQAALTGLTTGTLYHFRVRSTDASNSSAASGDLTFATAGDTTAPTVSITSPAANATLSGTVNVDVTASDNVGVASVQLKIDNANSGAAVTAAPYVIAVNTSSLSNGNHLLTAVASDAAGNSTTSASVAVKVNNTTTDTTPPTVSMSAPANGATVSATISITANASDNVGVASVQFQLDGANLGSQDTASPYSVSWNTTTSSNGSHTLRAIAKDAAGNSTTSASVTVTVNNTTTDTTPPTVSMSAPANGATVNGTISVTANASDNVGVASVQFQLDGANLGSLDTASPYSVSWNTTTSSNGSHTLRAIAKDAAGNSTTSAAVTVTVSNSGTDTTPPSVPTGLTAGAASSSEIDLSWNASTDNVGVTGYNVFRGGAKIGTSTTSSYADAGLTASTSFSYTVSAFDAAGNTSAQSASASATTLPSTGGGGGIPSTLGWYQIPNTTLQTVAPSNSQLSSWGLLCASGCSPQNVIAAWNSGVADTSRNRLVIWGGGHGDYWGNEFYSLNLTANPITLTRLNDPSTLPSGYNGCSDAYPDGKAASRHTYDGLTYAPNVDSMLAFSGSLTTCGAGSLDIWSASLSTLAWADKVPNSGMYQGIPMSDYDPNTGLVLFHDSAQLWIYNPSTSAFNTASSFSGVANNLGYPKLVVDPVDKFVFLIGDGNFYKYNVSSGTPPYARQDLSGTVTGCAAIFQNGGGHGLGAAWDPVQKLIVGWTGGNSVTLFNPLTNSCSSVTYSGGPGAQQNNGTFGRFRYFPALGVFVLVNDWAQNAYALRLTPAAGGTNPSGPTISSVGATSITTSGATINWTTDVGATTQVEYGTTTAYGTSTTLNASLVTSHSVSLTGLSSGTLYHYRVHSKNSGGTESISGDFAFATNNTTDTTPPAVSMTSPAGGATVSATINVAANATDNVGVTAVQFLLDAANLGAPLTTPPYTVAWDTTTAANGSHTLLAQASDAAGNVGTSSGISVTVSNSTSTADQNFQSRCTATGVIVCQGFDTASAFAQATDPNSGFYYSSSCPTLPTKCIQQDTSVLVSGGSSARWDIYGNTSDDAEGHYDQQFGSTAFNQNSTFYVQYAFRVDPNWLMNWENVVQSSPKIANFYNSVNGSCAAEELATNNHNGLGLFQMYSFCGGQALDTSADGVTPNPNGLGTIIMQQGFTAAAPSTGYDCQDTGAGFATGPGGGLGCFTFQPNTWYTLYYKVHVGTWGQPNSGVEAWIAPYGTQLKKIINLPNGWIINQNGGGDAGFNRMMLTQFMTNKNPNASHPTAHVWYDELIISSQPITAPAGQTP